MSLYEKNLELLGRYAPVAALFARGAVEEKPIAAESDAEEWFAGLDLEGTQVIYCFGLGAGTYYRAAKGWLRAAPNRYFVFLENHMPVIDHFLRTELATEVLGDRRVRIALVGESAEGDELLQQTVDYFARLPCTVTALSSYAETRADFAVRLAETIYTMAHTAEVTAFHSLDMNYSFYQLFYPAVRALAGSFHGSALFNRFKGIPAIICGAGPSLDAQLPLLGELEDRALIFAGGSGFTALTRAGVRPHFGAGMSPAPDEVERFKAAKGDDVPFFWKFRLNPEALDEIHGPKLYQSQQRGTGIISWVEEELGIPEAKGIFEGPSIIYYLTALVHELGCDPIIYVGVDLALTGGKGYSEQVGAEGTSDEQLVGTRDIQGQETETYWKWLHERKSLGKLVQAQAPTRYINCTEGGLGIEGVPNRTLQEVTDEHLKQSRDLSGMVEIALSSVPLNISEEAVEQVLGILKQSLERTIALIDQMVDALQRLSDRVQLHVDRIVQLVGEGPTGFAEAGRLPSPWGDVEPWLADGRVALLQLDLEEEPAWHQILKPMVDQRAVFHRRLYDEFIAAAGKREAFRTQRRLNIEQEHFLFLQKAARTNLSLI